MRFRLTEKFLRENGIFNEITAERFEKYFDLVSEANSKFNLTAITDTEGFDSKHFYDSLAAYGYVKNARSVCDMGSGAGFPGIPLAIVCPDVSFTLVDSLKKRTDFLDACIKELGLSNCKAVHARAEEHASSHREEYDACTSRAVAPLNTLAELCTPLIKKGGLFLAYKGKNAHEEEVAAKNAYDVLGLRKKEEFVYECAGEKRFILVGEKISSTPVRYPRGGNKPRTRPI